MNYVCFCAAFLFCAFVACIAFLFCARVVHVEKNEKLDPIHAIKPEKKITALSRMKKEQKLAELLDRG